MSAPSVGDIFPFDDALDAFSAAERKHEYFREAWSQKELDEAYDALVAYIDKWATDNAPRLVAYTVAT